MYGVLATEAEAVSLALSAYAKNTHDAIQAFAERAVGLQVEFRRGLADRSAQFLGAEPPIPPREPHSDPDAPAKARVEALSAVEAEIIEEPAGGHPV